MRTALKRLSAPKPSAKPSTIPIAMAARQTFSVASRPTARIGNAMTIMLQSMDAALSGQYRNRIRQVHVETKPLLLQRMQRAVCSELAQLLVNKADQRGVIRTCCDARPVIRADALDDSVFARRILQDERKRRQCVEHAVHF